MCLCLGKGVRRREELRVSWKVNLFISLLIITEYVALPYTNLRTTAQASASMDAMDHVYWIHMPLWQELYALANDIVGATTV